MIRTELSSLLGVAFVVVAGLNVWLMFQRMSPAGAGARGARLAAAHRAGGYLYLALYLVMMYLMLVRLQEAEDELGARALIHMILGLTIAPLLFVKVLIARTYKSQSQYLTPLGLILFSLSFVLVGMTTGPYLLRRAAVETISLKAVGMKAAQVDMRRAEELMRARCGRCHALDRVVGARKDAQGWLETVNRMRQLPGAGFTEEEGTVILSYLIKALGVDSTQPAGQQLVERALVDARCGRCHTLDVVYRAEKTPEQWKATIGRMVKLAPPGHFKPGEARQILEYLSKPRLELASATTAGEAGIVQNGTSPATSASSSGGTTGETGASGGSGATSGGTPGATASKTRRGSPVTPWLVVLGAMGWSGYLYWRSSGGRRPPSVLDGARGSQLVPRSDDGPIPTASRELRAASREVTEQPTPAPTTAAMGRAQARVPLTLGRIIAETPTAKTFRFMVPPGVELPHQAGQFLTFDWMVNGQKVVRSYSISSSPSCSRHHLDITVKRVPDGCVSCYLHDRVEVGLTVSARTPAGKFVLGDPAPRRLLCLAAGSGITPVMSILRWIDHAGLPVEATLLYSCRGEEEIIFRREIEGLELRVPGFRAHITLTQPSDGWSGERGRLDRQMVERLVPSLDGVAIFLCGPRPFMEATREVLSACGVTPDRIRQELFGGPPAQRESASREATEAGPTATFARSGKRCAVPEGSTILETAEMEGVSIPYSCRQGQCGTCATRLLDGEVRMDAEDGLDPDLRRQGYVLTCVGRARSDVILEA